MDALIVQEFGGRWHCLRCRIFSKMWIFLGHVRRSEETSSICDKSCEELENKNAFLMLPWSDSAFEL